MIVVVAIVVSAVVVAAGVVAAIFDSRRMTPSAYAAGVIRRESESLRGSLRCGSSTRTRRIPRRTSRRGGACQATPVVSRSSSPRSSSSRLTSDVNESLRSSSLRSSSLRSSSPRSSSPRASSRRARSEAAQACPRLVDRPSKPSEPTSRREDTLALLHLRSSAVGSMPMPMPLKIRRGEVANLKIPASSA